MQDIVHLLHQIPSLPFLFELFSRACPVHTVLETYSGFPVGLANGDPSRRWEGGRRVKLGYLFPWPPAPISSHLRLMKDIALSRHLFYLTFSFLVPLTTLFLHSPSSRNSNSCIPYSLPNTKHTFKNSPFANTLSLKYPDLSVPSVSLWVPVLETVSVPPRCLLLGQCTPLLLCLLLMAYNCTLLQRVAFGLRSQVGQKCLGS